MPLIHAFTDSATTFNRLSLVYGVQPHVVEIDESGQIDSDQIVQLVKKHGIVNQGEVILVVHGSVWKQPGMTNTLKVLTVN